jgi:hypothetical protein
MTASGTVSAGRTKLLTFTLAALIRPENGAWIVLRSFSGPSSSAD